jgi:uncharacterized membrane protein
MRLPDDWQALLVQLLAVPGMLVAYYLLLYHNGVLFTTCTISDIWDCGQVSGPGSPYSSIGPVPIALLGLSGYAAIFAAVWLREWIPFIDENLPELLMGLVGLAFLFSLGLTLLEAFVIGAYCQYCIVSAGIVLVMTILTVHYLITSRRAAAA